MKITLSLLVLIMLVGCVETQKISKQESDTRVFVANSALKASKECGEMNVRNVDDGISDASTVALALANFCSKEYEQSIKAWAEAKINRPNERMMFENSMRSSRQKIETFLPTVMNYRNLIKKIDGSVQQKSDIKQSDQKNNLETF